ncbi:MAG: hypothetical protein U0414_09965 [Polyangiaceae bacterium]
MTTEQDEPTRLFDGGDDALRRALHEARDELPSEARMDAIFRRLPGGDGGGGGGDPPAPPAAPPRAGFGGGGAILAAVGTVILGGAIYLAVRPAPPRTSASAGPHTSAESSAPAVTALATVPSAELRTSATARSPLPAVALPSGGPSLAPSASTAPRSEIDLLREAQSSAASSPAHALALCDEHARLYPSGALSEEREFIRIQALMAAGRVGEARSLADAFEARHPGSAHNVRLEEIVGRAKPAPSAKP